MYTTREEWLNACANELAPVFASVGAPLPDKIRIAIGFPSTGRKGKRIGECWDSRCSADGTFEILIRPDIADAMEVCAILAHELTHAAVGLKAKHGKPFARVAKAIGLEGKMTATYAGEAFKQTVAPMLQRLGALPHAKLGIGLSSAPPKQKTRLLKAICPECGYTVRVTAKWLAIGAPCCPDHGPMDVDGQEPDED